MTQLRLELETIKSEQQGIASAFWNKLKSFFHLETFIETGTYTGETTAKAGEIFSQVHSIELSQELFQAARQRFINEPHIHLHQGDSAQVFLSLLPQIERKNLLFWLDGHFSGGTTAQGDKDTPIIEEIKNIGKFGITHSVILVDDLRLFSEHAASDYPTIAQLRAALAPLFQNMVFILFGDVAIAYEASSGVEPSPLLRAMTTSRLFDAWGAPASEETQCLAAEEFLRTHHGSESAALEELGGSFPGVEPYGYGGHYHLWAGLTLWGKQKYTEAKDEFTRALQLNARHWRLHCYIAQCLAAMGDTVSAMEHYQIAAKASPDSPLIKQTYQSLLQQMQGTEPPPSTTPPEYHADTSTHPRIGEFRHRFQEVKSLLENHGRFRCDWKDHWACLDDATGTTSSQYTFPTAWAARIIAQIQPSRHADFSSALWLSTLVSAFIPVDFYEFRPAQISISGLQSRKADLTALALPDNSQASISCLHVLEHIGLGRYGDAIDPQGDLKAAAELKRVLAQNGNLLIAVPVGHTARILFDHQRIYTYQLIQSAFAELETISFSLVTDKGEFIANANEADANRQVNAVGLWHFRKQPRLSTQNPGENSQHYDDAYFQWQVGMGRMGSQIDSFKFIDEIPANAAIADIGCGSGYMLDALPASKKLGVEINPAARAFASKLGINTVAEIAEIPDQSQDVVISHHALEHMPHPFTVAQEILRILKPGGRCVIVVPCEGPETAYQEEDINQHLYTWHPAGLGNLFKLAGFRILSCQAFQHQWPDDYERAFATVNWEEFHRNCIATARSNHNFQIHLVASKPSPSNHTISRNPSNAILQQALFSSRG